MGAFLNPNLLRRAMLDCRQLQKCRFFSSIKTSMDDGLASITMTSPKTRNALSLSMISELHSEIGRAHHNPEVRCIVLRAEGPAFSSGHNLKEMTTTEGREYHQTIFRRCNELMLEIVHAAVPVIAVVDGVAAAAGCQLVAICDIAIATEKSTFSTPGSNFGLFCSTPGVPLARSVPRKISAYMLMTGLPLSAEDALNFGLISKLAKDAEHLEQELDRIVDAVKSKPRGVVALGKKFYYRQMELGLTAALSEGGQVMVENLSLKDCQEGIRAFKQKSKPVWLHTDEKVH